MGSRIFSTIFRRTTNYASVTMQAIMLSTLFRNHKRKNRRKLVGRCALYMKRMMSQNVHAKSGFQGPGFAAIQGVTCSKPTLVTTLHLQPWIPLWGKDRTRCRMTRIWTLGSNRPKQGDADLHFTELPETNQEEDNRALSERETIGEKDFDFRMSTVKSTIGSSRHQTSENHNERGNRRGVAQTGKKGRRTGVASSFPLLKCNGVKNKINSKKVPNGKSQFFEKIGKVSEKKLQFYKLLFLITERVSQNWLSLCFPAL